nr:MAG TPA: hypothetical protein [Caudoviricetes sp.]DAN00970.1 MAG TPA: hypothetical protein [Caudoviricetes sp.]
MLKEVSKHDIIDLSVGKPLVFLKQSLAVKGEAAVSFFLRQKQINPLTNGFCPRHIVFNTIFIKAFCCFIVQSYLYIVPFGVVYFRSAGSWRHCITSLFEFHKFII